VLESAIGRIGTFQVNGKPYKFSLQSYDDQSDSTQVVNLATQLKSAGVKIVFCCASSVEATPAVNVFKGALQFVGASGTFATFGGKPGYENLIHTLASNSGPKGTIATTMPLAAKVFGSDATKIGILWPNDQTSNLAIEAFNAYAPASGLQVVATQRYEASTVNFAPALTALKNAGAQALFAGYVVASDIAIVQQSEQLGLFNKFWVQSTDDKPGNAYRTKPGFVYLYQLYSVQVEKNSSNPAVASWAKELFATSEIPGSASYGIGLYEAAFALRDAMVAVGSVDNITAIAARIRGHSFDSKGMLFPVSFDSDGQIGTCISVAVIQASVNNGQTTYTPQCPAK
jgi:ABC-type branched-subunit amino acid transport system substrate-binding protein